MKTDPFLLVGKTVNSVIALPPQYGILSSTSKLSAFVVHVTVICLLASVALIS